MLVWLLPSIHLLVCILFAITRFDAWRFLLFTVDLPVAPFIIALLYNHDRPLLLIGGIGTIWCCLVSLAALYLWNLRLRSARDASS